jgi:ubiquitin C-terminal hydrolase
MTHMTNDDDLRLIRCEDCYRPWRDKELLWHDNAWVCKPCRDTRQARAIAVRTLEILERIASLLDQGRERTPQGDLP